MRSAADLRKLLENILRSTPLFQSMAEQDFAAVAPAFRERRVRPGQTLFRQASPGDSMFVVGRGRLAARIERPDGSTTALRDLGPGDVIGEMSCIDPAPRSATVLAAADSIVFELDRTTLRAMREHAPSVAVTIIGGVIHQLTDRLRDIDAQIDQTLKGDRKDRPQETKSADGGSFMDRVYRYMKGSPAPPPDPRGARVEEGPRPTPVQGPVDLSGLRSLEGLRQQDLDLLVNAAPPMSYPNGAYLCREGAPASSCFLMARGTVQVIKSLGGNDRVLATLGSGAFVGQMALIDHAPRSASVKAAGSAIVLALERSAFDKLLAARSPLGMRFQEQIAIAGIRQLRMASARLSGTLTQLAGSAPAEQQSRSVIEFHPEREGEVAASAPAGKRDQPMRTAPARPAGPASQTEDAAVILSYVKTTLREWDMSLEDLEKVAPVKLDD